MGELFSMIDDKKQDAHIHDAILEEGTESKDIARKIAKEIGLSDEQLKTIGLGDE